jgi:hypothetical protein
MLVASFPPHLVPGGTRTRKVANLLHVDTLRWILNFFNAFRFAIDNATPSTSSCHTQIVLDADIFTFHSRTSSDPAIVAAEQAGPLLDQARVFRGSEETIQKIKLGYGDIGDDFFMRMPLSIEHLNAASDLINQLTAEFDKNIELLALLNEAAFLILQTDFHRSLITSWAVCEHLINREWEHYLDSTNQEVPGHQTSKTLNSDRRKALIEGTDWTASSKLEVLELSKKIPFQLFSDLRKIRRARNGWLHSLASIDGDTAHASFRVGRELMSRKLGVELSHRGAFYTDAAAFEKLPD